MYDIDIENPNWVKEYINKLFNDENLSYLYNKYLNKYSTYIMGRTRMTFIGKGHVVKLPWSFDGFADNDWEGSLSTINYDINEFQYARTRLVYWNKIPVLFMEYVKHLNSAQIEEKFGKIPFLVDFIDCQQVGINAKQQLVAYDYGLH